MGLIQQASRRYRPKAEKESIMRKMAIAVVTAVGVLITGLAFAQTSDMESAHTESE